MTLTYDPATDQLLFDFNPAATLTSEWRMARRHLDIAVDEANEPTAILLHKATWNCPEVRTATRLVHRFIDMNPLPHAAELLNESRIQHALEAAIAQLLIPGIPLLQPQLVIDGIPDANPVGRRQKGICFTCGAVAPDRRRSTTRCGWPNQSLCRRCFKAEVTQSQDSGCRDTAETRPTTQTSTTWTSSSTAPKTVIRPDLLQQAAR